MRIIRFEDSAGTTHYGIETPDGPVKATGDLFTGLVATTEKADVARLLAPLVPVNIMCIGLNYKRHAEESGMAVPERPVLFIKPTSTLANPEQEILYPPSEEFDYECELGVIIGKACKNVSKDDALDYVLGYTCVNDLSARDWQLKLDKQWARGKSFDTFCPIGPVLVTTDEIPNPNNLQIQTRISGETLQNSHTSDMIFDVKTIISYLSEGTTLLPGTLILTGTPEGVGMGRTPKRWLNPGDVCEIEIENIGVLRNTVGAK
jgi:2-keto-4-pentenoate hydratase/2-oxohepta-3-ene-1,7-dioic acid hydratase in catechol pathway